MSAKCVKRDKDGVVFGYTQILANKSGFTVISTTEGEQLNKAKAEAGAPGYEEPEPIDELKARLARENAQALDRMEPIDEDDMEIVGVPAKKSEPAAPKPLAIDFTDRSVYPNKDALVAFAKNIGVEFEDGMTRNEMEERLKGEG